MDVWLERWQAFLSPVVRARAVTAVCSAVGLDKSYLCAMRKLESVPSRQVTSRIGEVIGMPERAQAAAGFIPERFVPLLEAMLNGSNEVAEREFWKAMKHNEVCDPLVLKDRLQALRVKFPSPPRKH